MAGNTSSSPAAAAKWGPRAVMPTWPLRCRNENLRTRDAQRFGADKDRVFPLHQAAFLGCSSDGMPKVLAFPNLCPPQIFGFPSEPWLHLDRTARGDRDHRGAGGTAVAGPRP